MNIRVDDYLDVAHDAKKFRDLRRLIRALPEPERFDFIVEFAEVQPAVGWWLANACLRDRKLVERVFRRGFETTRIFRMSVLLGRTIPRIGLRRVLLIISEYVDSLPGAVDGALYALRGFFDGMSRREQVRFLGLLSLARAKGIILEPRKVIVPGS